MGKDSDVARVSITAHHTMFVEKWMNATPKTVLKDASISFVAMEMNRLKFRHFPVVEPTATGPRLVGIVSKYDIARGFPSNLNPFSVEVFEDSVSRPVSTVMTRRVITTTPHCPIEEAARTLWSLRIGALPVLRENRLVGIITESDLFEAFVSMTAAKSGGVRVLIESDTGDNPVPAVLQLSQEHRIDVLSLFSFKENRLRGKDLSIFRFASSLPAGFLQQISQLGYRVVSVEGALKPTYNNHAI